MVRKIWHEACGLQDMALRVWMASQMLRKKWIIQDIMERSFMLYKIMDRIWNGSCE
jgi:hypothetical protein